MEKKSCYRSEDSVQFRFDQRHHRRKLRFTDDQQEWRARRLIFDGNIQSLVGDFIYDESVNRAISVDSRGMLEVLKKVFGANDLVAELTAS